MKIRYEYIDTVWMETTILWMLTMVTVMVMNMDTLYG